MTKKEVRKAMRSLQDLEKLHIKSWGQIQKIGKTYAICGEVDDSDPMRDYSAWSYGWKESWILDTLTREGVLET